MSRRLFLIAMMALTAAGATVRAEIAPMSEDELAKKATSIVVGTVKANYKDTRRDAAWENSNGVVEIAVESVERGDDLKPGDVIFARFWLKKWIRNDLSPPPYGSGHDLHMKG